MGATNPRWKKFERDLARDVGTERVPVTGERDGADFVTPLFLFSAKFRKAAISAELSAWLDRVATKARFDDRIGVLVVRRHRRPRAEAVVLLRWADWLDLHHGKARPAPMHEEVVEIGKDGTVRGTGRGPETLKQTRIRDRTGEPDDVKRDSRGNPCPAWCKAPNDPSRPHHHEGGRSE